MAPVLNSMAAAKHQSSANKDEQNHHHHNSGGSKSKAGSSAAAAARPTPQEQAAAAALKCPRCDSQNTKFCYYNNYSLTQPRHFCKTCRRYWTKGGALRNVPIGGGCRKNKKTSTKSAAASRLISNLESNNKDNHHHILSSATTDMGGGLKFFHGLTPAMDFQLGGLRGGGGGLHSSSSPTTTTTMYSHQFTPFGDMAALTTPTTSSPSGGVSSLMGFNNIFPFSNSVLPKLQQQGDHHHQNTSSIPPPGGGGVAEVHQEMGSHHTSLASSIESLSSINQDLHWKLQQQRLAMLFGSENNHPHKEANIPLVGNEVQPQPQHQQQKPQPILFHNLELMTATPKIALGQEDNSSRREGSTSTASAGAGNLNLSTEWFFDNSYAPVTPTPTNSSSNGNGNGNGNHDNHHTSINNWNGIQAWSNMSHFNEL